MLKISPRGLLEVIDFINHNRNAKKTSSVKGTQLVNVPWAFRLLVIVARSHVDQVVGAVMQRFADHKGAFPRSGEFMHAIRLLDQSEDQVAFAEGAMMNSAVVVTTQALLVIS